MKKLLVSLPLLLAVACHASEQNQQPAGVNWKNYCANCHANDGSGQTPQGKRLKVGDLSVPGALSEISDARLFKNIRDGLPGKDGGPGMSPFADDLATDEIKDLVDYVRMFGGGTKVAKK
jgi:mono/diheme cytochrome c family protein